MAESGIQSGSFNAGRLGQVRLGSALVTFAPEDAQRGVERLIHVKFAMASHQLVPAVFIAPISQLLDS
jgi:hypothetical protein